MTKERAIRFGKRAFLIVMIPLAILVAIYRGLMEMRDLYRDMWADTDSWEIS